MIVRPGPRAARSARASARPPASSSPPTATSSPAPSTSPTSRRPSSSPCRATKERYVAKVVATDQTRMLTLLKIEAKRPAGAGGGAQEGACRSASGPWPWAGPWTGRPQAGPPPSISVGIISAVGRIWGKAIQTDAKVSPVNYGGPLVDIEGRVQGILVPASPRGEGETAGVEWYDSGIGFAIPLEDVLAVLPRLKEGKDLKKGLLGVTVQGADQFDGPADDRHRPAGLRGRRRPASRPATSSRRSTASRCVSQAQVLHRLGTKYEGDTIASPSSAAARKCSSTRSSLGRRSDVGCSRRSSASCRCATTRAGRRGALRLSRRARPRRPASRRATASSRSAWAPARRRPFSGRDQFAALLSYACSRAPR